MNATPDQRTDWKSLALVLMIIVAAGIVLIVPVGVQGAEPLNTTVEVTNDTDSVYVETEFASGIDDVNATADVAVADPSGTEIANETLSGNASETVVEEWAINDSDPTGTYSVVVMAGSGIVGIAEAGTFNESGGAGAGSGSTSTGTLLGGLVGVLIAIGIVMVWRDR